MKTYLMAFALAALFFGCAKPDISDQSAEYWYRQMAAQIAKNNLDLAGDRYSSLASEHLASPLLAEAALMMANAHIDNEEYLLANFYFDEYLRRFGGRATSDRANYLKLLADYKGIKRDSRDQKLILDAIAHADEFKRANAASAFLPYSDTLKAKMRLANYELSQKIASLYDRMDKPNAAAYYRKIGGFKPIKDGEYEPSQPFWLRKIFE
ncbi:outer membrane protein assembly factor BamD [Campylobacterota bacterium]|nr:outer membrane protein assembly factor BamD [Campylobacterota bacterium]